MNESYFVPYIIRLNEILNIAEEICNSSSTHYDMIIHYSEKSVYNNNMVYCGNFVMLIHIRTIRLLKIVMKRRYMKKTLRSRCRTIVMINKIDYMNENIPQELKEYLTYCE